MGATVVGATVTGGAVVVVVSGAVVVAVGSGTVVDVVDAGQVAADGNRRGKRVRKARGVRKLHVAFEWNRGDDACPYWYPQGITGTADALPKRGFVLQGRHPVRIRVLDPIPPDCFADIAGEFHKGRRPFHFHAAG